MLAMGCYKVNIDYNILAFVLNSFKIYKLSLRNGWGWLRFHMETQQTTFTDITMCFSIATHLIYFTLKIQYFIKSWVCVTSDMSFDKITGIESPSLTQRNMYCLTFIWKNSKILLGCNTIKMYPLSLGKIQSLTISLKITCFAWDKRCHILHYNSSSLSYLEPVIMSFMTGN